MVLLRCKMNALGLFVSFLYLFYCFFVHLFLFLLTKIQLNQNAYIVIINIVINIKKGSG